jgi:hypothetical protein
VIPGPHACAHVGTQDCNPGRNPGGAFCCLDDANEDVTDAGLETCPALLDDAGFTSLDDFPIAELCATSERGLIEWTNPCEGSIIVVEGSGVDCNKSWLFDAMTRKLQAKGAGCNVGDRCTAGAPGFLFPTGCFDGNFSTGAISICPDAGARDAAKD